MPRDGGEGGVRGKGDWGRLQSYFSLGHLKFLLMLMLMLLHGRAGKFCHGGLEEEEVFEAFNVHSRSQVSMDRGTQSVLAAGCTCSCPGVAKRPVVMRQVRRSRGRAPHHNALPALLTPADLVQRFPSDPTNRYPGIYQILIFAVSSHAIGQVLLEPQ